MKLAIVDYGCGNIGSLMLSFGRFGVEPLLTGDPEDLASADRVLLPGVGAAGHAMEQLRARELDRLLPTLRQPALGICLGMQLLFDGSEEADTEGLGIVPGRVRALEPAPGLPVPHMGWSKVSVSDEDLGLDTGDYLYFAHGYAADIGPATAASAEHVRPISAVVRSGNWLGAQFHPERSGEAGARFLKAFLS
ncbi:imidazole glycerol phosphate synthase subunit HisH [Sphingomonas ginkgonis]|uniref:Imidazole glycerol phosphate synthase subunit HisH n=1 Tax=Sphingomonas ginkgonis TaxID=2315330 RepID=A0A3R9YK05_9SPHN|nr:imidazole glycerol phosphate synthase subunit HisH [Sphingomonas ginkgonis]RST29497.1 imidazole glycerol phosphate synthase subunit HisH [Sphingomonas ginkgonis]